MRILLGGAFSRRARAWWYLQQETFASSNITHTSEDMAQAQPVIQDLTQLLVNFDWSFLDQERYSSQVITRGLKHLDKDRVV